jgi:hypothetical protein
MEEDYNHNANNLGGEEVEKGQEEDMFEEEEERHVKHAQRHHNEVSYVNFYLGNEPKDGILTTWSKNPFFALFFFPIVIATLWVGPLHCNFWCGPKVEVKLVNVGGL